MSQCSRVPAPAFDINTSDNHFLGNVHSQSLSTLKNVLVSCAQTLFAMHTLKHYGLEADALHAVFQATVVAKLSSASPAWWGYANADDKARLEAFLRRSSKLGYRAESEPTLANICADADRKLFSKVLSNEMHLLRPLRPPPRDENYYLRTTRPNHNLQLPIRTWSLNGRNFLNSFFFKDLNQSQASLRQKQASIEL